ncbi:hypothetical protein ACIQVR_37255 [Streptomyces xanthochromogenes]|uniref:hypothetical protein n=1 Tax=Streptomyces xanthochromogenes TaxID=67384 RepID=UPI00382824F8
MESALPGEPDERVNSARPSYTDGASAVEGQRWSTDRTTEEAGTEGERTGLPVPGSVGSGAPGPVPPPRTVDGDEGGGGRLDEPGSSFETDEPMVREARRVLRAAVADLRQEALFNFGEMNAVKLTAVLGQLLEHSELPRPYLKTVRAVFAEPDGYQKAYDRLANPGAVLVLPREPGAGRTFTAHALLADLHFRTGARVGPLAFGGTNRFPVRRLPTEENAAYLLDLPTDEDGNLAVADDFGATLHHIQRLLEKRSSRLIVLTTPEQWQRIQTGAPDDLVPDLGRPDPVKVARTWLTAEAPDLDTSLWLSDSRIQGILDGQAPSDVLQIVALILKAEASRSASRLENATDEGKHTADNPSGFTDSVLSVVKARTNWRRELLDWHSKPGRTNFERNFLLVAALLRNAAVAHVYVKTAELCKAFNTSVSLRGQEAPGVLELVDKIEADLHPVRDTLEFGRPGWDDAVLSYFWIDRPAARKAFLGWMAQAPAITGTNEFLESFTREERLLLANRVGAFAVRWAARHRKADPLEKIISAWQRDSDLWKAAIDLVSAAAFHPTMARFVHELLLRWSKSKEDAALPRLTVEVCAGEFGRRHTTKAMVRLKHAAASDDPAVQKSLYAAVRTIWADSTARESLFDAIKTWCAPDSDRLVSGRRCFAALATLTAGHGDAGVSVPVLLHNIATDGELLPPPESLSIGWGALLSSPADDPEPAAALALWMDAARQDKDLQPLVFGALRGALSPADPEQARELRNRLNDLLYAWQPFPAVDADPIRVQMRHELTDLLFHDRSRSVAKFHPRAVRRAEDE